MAIIKKAILQMGQLPLAAAPRSSSRGYGGGFTFLFFFFFFFNFLRLYATRKVMTDLGGSLTRSSSSV